MKKFGSLLIGAHLLRDADCSLRQVKHGLSMRLQPAGIGPNNTLRTLTSNILETYFLPYGCWCNFDALQHNKAGSGHGTAIDDWDQNCRNLVEGYECAILDALERGEDCVPWEADYPNTGYGMSENTIFQFCAIVATDFNTGVKDQCVEAACIVEAFFMNKIAEFLIPGAPAGFINLDKINMNFLHERGFDKSKECEVIAAPGNGQGLGGGNGGGNGGGGGWNVGVPMTEKACCGDYPIRFPYKDTENRFCCENMSTGEGKTYNPFSSECCDDGTIQSIGSQC